MYLLIIPIRNGFFSCPITISSSGLTDGKQEHGHLG